MDLSNTKVVFFDVHETLIHIKLSPPEIFHALCDEVGADVSLAAIQERYPNPETLEVRREAHGNDTEFWRDFNASLVADLGLADPNEALSQFITDGFLRDQWWATYHDAKPALVKLKAKGYKLAVIANAREVLLGRLKQVKLIDFFDSITYSHEVGVAKPDPKIFKTALERVGATPREAVHIGDRMREDVEGANTVGITSVLLDRENEHVEFDGLRVQNLDEFVKIFE